MLLKKKGRSRSPSAIQKQIDEAVNRANGYYERFTTVAADEFLHDWLHPSTARTSSTVGEEDLWKNLPHNLNRLVERLEKEHQREEETKTTTTKALYAAVFLRAPRGLMDSFQTLFVEVLRARSSSALRGTADDDDDDEDENSDGEGADDNGSSDSDTMEDEPNKNKEDNENRFNADESKSMVEDIDDRKDIDISASLGFDERLFYRNLQTLGWLKKQHHGNVMAPFSPVHKSLMEAVQIVLMDVLTFQIKGEYSEYGLWDNIQRWKNDTLKPWLLQSVLMDPNHDVDNNQSSNANRYYEEEEEDDWNKTIDFAVAEAFVSIRTNEMFDIVTDFPDSLPAVDELRLALDYTTHLHRQRLAYALRDSLQRRLLHPGANTTQILDVYINVVKVLSILDPTSFSIMSTNNSDANNMSSTTTMMNIVAHPVQQYARERQDTVRCIVMGLTDEKSGGDLYKELRRQKHATLLEQSLQRLNEEGMPPDPHWQPPALPRQTAFANAMKRRTKNLIFNGDDNDEEEDDKNKQVATTKKKTTPPDGNNVDILAMLVGIYGNQEYFVNEYRLMLADKLLDINLHFNTEKEVHTLELLKLRFGETSLRQCEIMIKDVDDSKRIVSNIQSSIVKKGEEDAKMDDGGDQDNSNDNALQSSRTPTSVVEAVIVSDVFWPSLSSSDAKRGTSSDTATGGGGATSAGGTSDEFKLHPRIQGAIDEFTKGFEKLKNPMKLLWYKQLGTVQVDLSMPRIHSVDNDNDMSDGDDDDSNEGNEITREFQCTPLQATVISYFEDDDVWTASDLSNEIDVPIDYVKRRGIAFWVNQGVLRPFHGGTGAENQYQLATSFFDERPSGEDGEGKQGKDTGATAAGGSSGMDYEMEDDDDDDNGGDGANNNDATAAAEAEKLKVFEMFVKGMVNQGPKTIQEIHNNLTMFVGMTSEHKYDFTQQQLSAFLHDLCQKDVLELRNDHRYTLAL